MCNPTRKPTDGTVPIRFGTYNIRNGQKGGLEAALRGMSQANMDLGILQGKKLTDGVYNHRSDKYSIIATDALSRHCVRVTVFYWLALYFAVVAVQKFGPNIVGSHLATGERWCYIIGCYLSPDATSTIESVITTLREQSRGAKPLVTGDINTKFLELEGDWRGEEIAATLASE